MTLLGGGDAGIAVRADKQNEPQLETGSGGPLMARLNAVHASAGTFRIARRLRTLG
jgi:hypothetical protein